MCKRCRTRTICGLTPLRQQIVADFTVCRCSTAKRPKGLPEDQELPGLDVSRSVLRYCLVWQLGYRWGKIRKKARKRDADRPALLRSYLLRYSEALQLEAQGKAVIVYFDEVCYGNARTVFVRLRRHLAVAVAVVATQQSYIHQNHAPDSSWINPRFTAILPRTALFGYRGR